MVIGGSESAARVLEIHTSDRILFKRCRRKWHFASPLRLHLEPVTQQRSALWFGTGFHFALEDYHGWNRFGHPVKAFRAYYEAFRPEELPEDHAGLLQLAEGMLNYYLLWLKRRDDFQTFWWQGHPQVEVDFEIPLPIKGPNGEEVVYAGTLDRVVVDPFGRLWVQDYKTVRTFDTTKLATDPQITAYCWAASLIYDRPVEGVVYTQFLKDVPKPPMILKDGSVSVNKNQRTTHALYRETLKKVYGDVSKAPRKNIEFLNMLAEKETAEGDIFIRRDLVRRNQHFLQAEFEKILAEVQEMLNPNLPLYPNPTRDCIWDCEFRSVCIAMDDGSDWEFILQEEFRQKQELPEWRSRIKWPEGGAA